MPALILQGLFKIKETHSIHEGYYSLDSIILTIAFMQLCRIKTPQELSRCNAGELGKLIGYDRVPEMKCLREKLIELSEQQTNTEELNKALRKIWITDTEDLTLYVDGHVKIYTGDKAQLPKKYVSRQKLCLPGITDFYVNDTFGSPVMFYRGELNEKLQQVIEHNIIPTILAENDFSKVPIHEPIFTLIFDREAFDYSFFIRLWQDHRIAIVTYKKYVKDSWNVNLFSNYNVSDRTGNIITMRLCEKELEYCNFKFREIRCWNSDEHQTAIISTHPSKNHQLLASALFNRWQQENYFKYMLENYSLDHIYQYGVQEVNQETEVINPLYRKCNYQIKKEKEKLGRFEKQLVKNIDLSNKESIDEIGKNLENEKLIASIESKKKLIKELQEELQNIKQRIKIKDMPEQQKYNTLKTQSQLFMGAIKMICYRAETATANFLIPHYKNAENDKRMLIKEIINTSANIEVDKVNNKLIVTIHCLSRKSKNDLLLKLCNEINESEVKYPNTNLTLFYKCMAT